MERYESKQVQIVRPTAVVYESLSDFSNFTPILADKVDSWVATSDSCSFKAKGFAVNLRIVEREPNKRVKIEGEDGKPFEFTFWIQMVEVGAVDTRLRLVLDVKLNKMMQMMIGGKIQSALDQMVDQIAAGFNSGTI